MALQGNGKNALYAFGVIALLSCFWTTPAQALCTPLGTTTSAIGLCKPQGGETGWTAAINANWDLVDANVGTIPTGAVMFYAGNSPPTGWYACDGSAKSRTTDSKLYAIVGTTYGVGDGSTTFNIPDGRSRTPMFAGTGSFVSSTDFSNVNTGTDVITVTTNNSLYTGTAVTFATTGAAPAGLVNGNPYFVINVSSTSIKLASSLANAVAGTQIDLTTQGSGTHSVTVAYTTRNLADVGGEETHAETITEMPSHTHVTGSALPFAGGGAFTFAVGTSTITTVTGSTGGSTAANNMQPFLSFTCMVKR
ncbi:MAG: tail fiber protein [Actinobacteria bacterium]|nr:MAG: tail fiber protein [Actinomycetota bacterium]